MSKVSNLLLTGKPGIGKTTLIKRIIYETSNIEFAGFYTQEIRKGGKRIGFQLIWVPENFEEILAGIDLDSRFRVGKYRVNRTVMDKVASRIKRLQNIDILVIDEIGPMELFSREFEDVVIDSLRDEKQAVIGTIQKKLLYKLVEWGVKDRVMVKELTRENFDTLYNYCMEWIDTHTGRSSKG